MKGNFRVRSRAIKMRYRSRQCNGQTKNITRILKRGFEDGACKEHANSLTRA